MRAKEVFASALKATGLTQCEIAKMIGIPEQSLGQKINIRESVRANEFMEILEAIGIEILFYVKETGDVLMKDSGHKHVRGMSDGVVYDTKEAKLVATSFFADGENEYGPDGKAQELYVDRQNRYFVAEYSSDENVKARVRSVPSDMAKAFIGRYGIVKDNPV